MVDAERLRATLKERSEGDKTVGRLLDKLEKGKGDYRDAHALAIRYGELLAGVFDDGLSGVSEALTTEQADAVIAPLLRANYNRAVDGALMAQRSLNAKGNIGMKAVAPKPNSDKVEGLVKLAAQQESGQKAAAALHAPVITYTQSGVDDTIKANVGTQARAGLNPRITREVEAGCCEWCEELAGSYDYHDVSDDIYRRHENCRCMTLYVPAHGRRVQDVWSKKWVDKKEVAKPQKSDKIENNSHSPSPSGINHFEVRGFRTKQKLNNHWQNGRTHQNEYLSEGITTKEAYQARALELIESKVGGNIKGHIDKDGVVTRYDVVKNDFVKGHPSKGIYTMFKPNEGSAYYENQRVEDIKNGGKA